MKTNPTPLKLEIDLTSSRLWALGLMAALLLLLAFGGTGCQSVVGKSGAGVPGAGKVVGSLLAMDNEGMVLENRE